MVTGCMKPTVGDRAVDPAADSRGEAEAGTLPTRVDVNLADEDNTRSVVSEQNLPAKLQDRLNEEEVPMTGDAPAVLMDEAIPAEASANAGSPDASLNRGPVVNAESTKVGSVPNVDAGKNVTVVEKKMAERPQPRPPGVAVQVPSEKPSNPTSAPAPTPTPVAKVPNVKTPAPVAKTPDAKVPDVKAPDSRAPVAKPTVVVTLKPSKKQTPVASPAPAAKAAPAAPAPKVAAPTPPVVVAPKGPKMPEPSKPVAPPVPRPQVAAPAQRPNEDRKGDAVAVPTGFAVEKPNEGDISEHGNLTPTIYFLAVVNEDNANCSSDEKMGLFLTSGERRMSICTRSLSFCSEQGSCMIRKGGRWSTFNVMKRVDGVDYYQEIKDACIYGYGVRNICLDPFYTVAADLDIYNPGDVIFVPKLRGLALPNGAKHDGYLIVRDQGRGVKGRGRFDFFSGGMNWKQGDNPFVRMGLGGDTSHDYMKVSGDLARRVRAKRGYPVLPQSGVIRGTVNAENTKGVPTSPL